MLASCTSSCCRIQWYSAWPVGCGRLAADRRAQLRPDLRRAVQAGHSVWLQRLGEVRMVHASRDLPLANQADDASRSGRISAGWIYNQWMACPIEIRFMHPADFQL